MLLEISYLAQIRPGWTVQPVFSMCFIQGVTYRMPQIRPAPFAAVPCWGSEALSRT
jgi:hypothetical protein